MYRIINQYDQPFGFMVNDKFYFISAKDELEVDDKIAESDILKSYPFTIEKITRIIESDILADKKINLKSNKKGG